MGEPRVSPSIIENYMVPRNKRSRQAKRHIEGGDVKMVKAKEDLTEKPTPDFHFACHSMKSLRKVGAKVGKKVVFRRFSSFYGMEGSTWCVEEIHALRAITAARDETIKQLKEKLTIDNGPQEVSEGGRRCRILEEKCRGVGCEATRRR